MVFAVLNTVAHRRYLSWFLLPDRLPLLKVHASNLGVAYAFTCGIINLDLDLNGKVLIMEPQFWHERWQKNEIGFHKAMPHLLLSQYWHCLGTEGQFVFVPLCGKSLDLLFLKEKGFKVVGCELSTIAVTHFFKEHGLSANTIDKEHYRLWQAEDLCILEGDFFGLVKGDLPPLQSVYDRAALVAFPEPMRATYAKKLLELAAPAPILLITFEHEGPKTFGPPFAVFQEEIKDLFGRSYEVTVLDEREAIAEMPHLPPKGIHSIREKAYYLESK